MSSKKEWGNACWYLFHTLAYKLKENQEKEIPVILDHILAICGNLPCPDCANHAIKTLKRLNRRAVNSKEMLVKTLFEFHNIVNRRIGKNQFTRKQHDEMYSRAQFFPIYNNFWRLMLINAKGEKAMMYNLARKNALMSLDTYLKKHIHIFNV
uniref:thiol oxidase n=1 Tax=viral metagenome TaxID=1070528 RepID=A0A6C0CS61_9ZZZZ